MSARVGELPPPFDEPTAVQFVPEVHDTLSRTASLVEVSNVGGFGVSSGIHACPLHSSARV